MKTYIKITKYCSGPSIKDQVNEIIDCGKLDGDTRLFFDKHNCINSSDIAKLLTYFEVKTDIEFDKDNIVFVPDKSFVRHIERDTAFRWK